MTDATIRTWAEQEARRIIEAHPDDLFIGHPVQHAIATALRRAEDRGIERAADVADGFTCGLCGMDGRAGQAIRALKSTAE